MVRQILSRPIVYNALGTFLLSVGIVLGCFLVSRLIREAVDNHIARQSDYLLIASTPVFGLPPATPLPTFTPTAIPTATPLPLPAIRLSIPTIGLNVPIQEISPTPITTRAGEQRFMWKLVPFAVSHHDTSGYPTGGTNIVLAGHNNTGGAVFQHLSELSVGDQVILFTADEEFRYQVQKKFIFPYWGAEAEADAKLRRYAAPTPTERVTLVSCWPYVTNAHRIVVIAIPSFEESEHAD